jgi:hypothetical protein
MTYADLAKTIGELVDMKNEAYGDSFHQAGRILEILYPKGIQTNQYHRVLYTARVIDKLFRLATAPDAFGENPAQDIAGYSILMCGKKGKS